MTQLVLEREAAGFMPELTDAQWLEQQHSLNIRYQMNEFFSSPLGNHHEMVRDCARSMFEDLDYVNNLYNLGYRKTEEFAQLVLEQTARTNYLYEPFMNYVKTKVTDEQANNIEGYKILHNLLKNVQRPLKKIFNSEPVFDNELKELSDFVDFVCPNHY